MKKPRLEQSWDKVIFLTGVDYFSTFRKTGLGNFAGAPTTGGKRLSISRLQNGPRSDKALFAGLINQE